MKVLQKPCVRDDDYFLYEFDDKGITNFNYMEFLFNTSTENSFIFDGNANILRCIDKAILKRDNIPYLSPELVLLYKARGFEQKLNQFDFEKTVSEMDDEQMAWFYGSLDMLYPNGHVWGSVISRY